MSQTIHLQFVGEHPAIPARDVKIGDVLVFNWGYTEKVRSITPNKSGKSLIFEYEGTDSNGKHWTQTKRVGTLVAINQNGEEYPYPG